MAKNLKETQAAMRTFLAMLNGDTDMWSLVGRSWYRRGVYGTFKLTIWTGGTHGAIAGLSGTFTPYDGGASDEIAFRFDDLIIPTNPRNNPNYRGEGVVGSSERWSWHIAEPESMRPFHDAIVEWVLIWDLRAKDVAEMERESAAYKRRKAGR
jgi:hypothetical protein